MSLRILFLNFYWSFCFSQIYLNVLLLLFFSSIFSIGDFCSRLLFFLVSFTYNKAQIVTDITISAGESLGSVTMEVPVCEGPKCTAEVPESEGRLCTAEVPESEGHCPGLLILSNIVLSYLMPSTRGVARRKWDVVLNIKHKEFYLIFSTLALFIHRVVYHIFG